MDRLGKSRTNQRLPTGVRKPDRVDSLLADGERRCEWKRAINHQAVPLDTSSVPVISQRGTDRERKIASQRDEPWPAAPTASRLAHKFDVGQSLQTKQGILGGGVAFSVDQKSNRFVPQASIFRGLTDDRMVRTQGAIAPRESDRAELGPATQKTIPEMLGSDQVPAHIATQIDDQARG